MIRTIRQIRLALQHVSIRTLLSRMWHHHHSIVGTTKLCIVDLRPDPHAAPEAIQDMVTGALTRFQEDYPELLSYVGAHINVVFHFPTWPIANGVLAGRCRAYVADFSQPYWSAFPLLATELIGAARVREMVKTRRKKRGDVQGLQKAALDAQLAYLDIYEDTAEWPEYFSRLRGAPVENSALVGACS